MHGFATLWLLTETRTGALVGNEAFTATGHILHRTTAPGLGAE
jgi:hypothetical protein